MAEKNAGNEVWNKLITKYEPFLGKWFVDENRKKYRLSGILWGIDDFYFYLTGELGTVLLSCVGDLKDGGYKLIE